MTEEIVLFQPRKHQVEIFKRLQRFNVLVCHRRFGKTVLCINILIRKALENQLDNARYAYIAPLFRQAKQVAWDYLKEYTKTIPGCRVYENDLRVDLPNGARIQLFGADNPDALRGIYLDGAILDEHAQMKPGLWGAVIRPLLTDRKGFAIFIGTPMGHNEFYDLYQFALSNPAWFSCVYRAGETGIIEADELVAAKREMSEEEYDQEFECSFEAAIRGSYYGELMRKLEEPDENGTTRIGSVPYDPALLVWTAWDLGHSDDTSIWFFQIAGQEVHFINYFYDSGKPVDFYTRAVLEQDYAYAGHLLPHDAKAMHLGMQKTIEEQITANLRNVTVLERESLENGIDAARNLIRRSWFDRQNCAQGIECLKQYRREFNPQKKVFKSTPLHDWCFTGETEVLTRYGMRQIMNLPETGEVLTLCGWKRYINPRKTRTNARLVEVRFTSGYTVKCTPDHMFLTESGWISARNLRWGTAIRSGSIRSRSISMVASTACGAATDIFRAAARGFIGMYGLARSALSPPGATFTTGMATLPTTGCPTSNALTQRNTFNSHGRKNIVAGMSISPTKRARRLLNGISRKKGVYGTGGKPKSPDHGRNGSMKTSPAFIVARWFRCLFESLATHKSIARIIARPLIIEDVRRLSERADVYDITVPGTAHFCLANGAVVHNCSHGADAFRYAAMGMPAGNITWEPLNYQKSGFV